MARKIKQSVFEKRMSILNKAREKLAARESAALNSIHEFDQEDAKASAFCNACDTMIERGRKNFREASFEFRKIYVATLENITDCAEDYGFRRS